MENINNSYNFNGYKILISENGRVKGSGIIKKGSLSYKVNLSLKATEGVNPSNVQNVYNQKIIELIEGFKIGSKVKSLYLSSDGMIKSTKLGPSGQEKQVPWEDFQKKLTETRDQKKLLLEKLSSKVDPELAEILQSIEYSNPEKSVKQIREILSTVPQELKPVLESIQRKQLQFVVKDFVKSQEPTATSAVHHHISEVSIESLKKSNAARVNEVGLKAIEKLTFKQKIVKSVKSFVYRIFLDGNAPWKQQKYDLALKGVREGFKVGNQDIRALYDEYSTKHQTGLSDYDKKVFDVLKFVNNAEIISGNKKDFRSTYRHFIIALRKALESKDYKEEVAQALLAKKSGEPIPLSKNTQILQEICVTRFTKVNMHTFLDGLVHEMIDAGHKEMKGVPKADVEKTLDEQQFEAIGAAPPEMKAPRIPIEWGKFSGSFNLNFDPHYKTNVPYVNYKMRIWSQLKEMICVRVGTPTMESTLFSARINPEWEAFIDAYELQGKNHVYVNLQKRVGREKNRTEALINLHKRHPDAFTVVVLEQDSAFYRQKDKYANYASPQGFTQDFRNRILGNDPKTGFFLPDHLKNNTDFKNEMINIMEKMSEKMLKDDMSVNNRKDFIELYYAALELLVLKHENPDSFNISCKDAIDRGGKNNAILFEMILIMEGKENDPMSMRELETMTHAPALIVKKQPIIHDRRNRLTGVMRQLQNKIGLRNGLKEVFTEQLNIDEPQVDIVKNPEQKLAV